MSQIVPGGVSPMMAVLGGDPIDELGRIERSLRLRPAALSRVSQTNTTTLLMQKITFSWWQKRAELGTNQCVFGGGRVSSGAVVGNYFGFNTSNQFQMTFDDGANAIGPYASSEVFRDVLSWEHIVLAFDTTQAVQADRMKLWRNNRAVTISNGLALNANLYFMYAVAGGAASIGCRDSSAFADYNLGGLLAHFACVVNQALTPASFAQQHPLTRQWRPRTKSAVAAVVNTGSTRSFFLPFDDATSLTTLCADASSKGNNFTATNVSLTAGATYDSLLDTPTTNYCCLNSLDKSSVASVTDGGYNFTYSSNAIYPGVRGSIGSAVEMFFEATLVAAASSANPLHQGVGITKATYSYDSSNVAINSADAYQYISNGQKLNAGTYSAYGSSYTAGDVIGIKMTANSLEFFKNGVSQGVAFSGLSGTFYACCHIMLNGVWALNFGQRPYAYPANAGTIKALCAKNLPRPSAAAANPASAFAAVTASGASILSMLAAAEQWTSYIRIVKRRDAAEGWRWMFSDDATNFLDSSTNGGKAAIPAFTGSAYVGYSLKVSAANGIATGRLVHTGGVADVVSDGLGNTRKAIILKNEATGAWYFYHPDLTAGKLLYLEQAVVETTDATISAVTSSGFTVASALASGTYRWISIAEISGLISLFSYAANNNADGPFAHLGLSFLVGLIKRSSVGGSGQFYDVAANPTNPSTTRLAADSTAGDVTLTTHDNVSGGIKFRLSGQDPNETGTYVGIALAAFAFRYSNAR